MQEHRKFEFYAGEYLRSIGFTNIDVTRGVSDWGADLFCEKDGVRYAGQVKMYGTSRTRISRKDVMELYGVMAYFDCQRALFVYNGSMTPDAIKAAEKLGIELFRLEKDADISENGAEDAEMLWNRHVKVLEGHEILTISGVSYHIDRVTDSCIHFSTSNNVSNTVKKDLFKWTVDRIASSGPVRAVEIRDEFKTRFSSVVAAVFRYIPGYSVGRGRVISRSDTE